MMNLLTVGGNIWPFISSKEALREPLLTAGTESLICLEAGIAK